MTTVSLIVHQREAQLGDSLQRELEDNGFKVVRPISSEDSNWGHDLDEDIEGAFARDVNHCIIIITNLLLREYLYPKSSPLARLLRRARRRNQFILPVNVTGLPRVTLPAFLDGLGIIDRHPDGLRSIATGLAEKVRAVEEAFSSISVLQDASAIVRIASGKIPNLIAPPCGQRNGRRI